MLSRSTVFILLFSLCLGTLSAAQQPEDSDAWMLQHLRQQQYAIDTSAPAVILFDSECVFVDPQGMVKRFKRIVHVLKPSGLGKADVSVRVYSPADGSGYFKSLRGISYNLEDGRLVKQAIDKSAAHFSPLSQNYLTAKFSLPSVKTGSIFMYEYEIHTPLSASLAAWNFQDDLPKLHSELSVHRPETFRITSSLQTRHSFTSLTKEDGELPEAYTINTDEGHSMVSKWVRRNLAAVADEPYANSLNNYRERMELQMSGENIYEVDIWAVNTVKHAGYTDYSTWDAFNGFLYTALMETTNQHSKTIRRMSEHFWEGHRDSLEVAQSIYRYFRDSTAGVQHLADRLDKRKLDLRPHMLLYMMLREAGFHVSPLLLGDREDIRLSASYPAFPHIVSGMLQVVIAGKPYYLFAGNRFAPFGYLPPQYYNGFSWVVEEQGYGVDLNTALLQERSFIQVTTVKNQSPADYEIKVTERCGLVTGVAYRNAWTKDTAAIRRYVAGQVKQLPCSPKLLSYQADNLYNPDTALVISYTVRLAWPSEEMVYLAPAFFNFLSENPFKAAERNLPIELPYAIDANLSVSLQLPGKYALEEKPQSSLLKIDDRNYYKYFFGYDDADNSLQLTTRLSLQQTSYDRSYYGNLKDFFGKVTEQQKNLVVLKNK